MPEGDTVWNTARALAGRIEGQTIERSDFRVPQLATVDLAGWTVAESACRGKHLLLRLTHDGSDSHNRSDSHNPSDSRNRSDRHNPSDGHDGSDSRNPSDGHDGSDSRNPRHGHDGRAREPLTLHSHLRMDGTWRTYAPGERWTGRPSHLIRVALYTPRAVAVGFHLHELAIVPTKDEERLVGFLGPDLMGADWDAGEAVRRLSARPERWVADALLDQRNLAGIGNLYKAETLFLRGLSPWTPVGEVADLPALVAKAHALLNSNRGRWTQTTTGSLRRGEANWVFERSGQPCRRCRTPVRRWTGGDHDRITYWCPACQPGAGPPRG